MQNFLSIKFQFIFCFWKVLLTNLKKKYSASTSQANKLLLLINWLSYSILRKKLSIELWVLSIRLLLKFESYCERRKITKSEKSKLGRNKLQDLSELHGTKSNSLLKYVLFFANFYSLSITFPFPSFFSVFFKLSFAAHFWLPQVFTSHQRGWKNKTLCCAVSHQSKWSKTWEHRQKRLFFPQNFFKFSFEINI